MPIEWYDRTRGCSERIRIYLAEANARIATALAADIGFAAGGVAVPMID